MGDAAGIVLWKIYNQDISWHIKRKILIAVLAFIWIFSSQLFPLESPLLALLFDHEEGAGVYLFFFFSRAVFLNIKKTKEIIFFYILS